MKLTKKERLVLVNQFVKLLYQASWEKDKYNPLMADLIELLDNEPYNYIVKQVGEMSTKQQAEYLINCLTN